MPEYFYHIGIELLGDNSVSSPVNLSQAFRSLNPFISQHSRSTRNHEFDTMRPSSSSTASSHVARHTVASSIEDRRKDQVTVVVPCSDDISAGIGTRLASAQTRAIFATTDESATAEYGIVHLYRDAEETPGLHQYSNRVSSHLWDGSAQARRRPPTTQPNSPPKDDECSMLAILAVPSYLTPKDFLAFVGQDTRDAVSHFRMIRTSRLNRYMVLMKFKDGRFARQWQHDWNGRVFNSMEPETCHVVFVKSVEILHNRDLRFSKDAPEYTANSNGTSHLVVSRTSVSALNKPLAPPTPSLVELPTCPVCLERMDESTGLLTVLCQHVFHCTCLEKWSGGGCPVCRYSSDDFSTAKPRPNKSKKFIESTGEFEVDDAELECGECRITQSLWQCLICGYVGCGRYAGKHAYLHYTRTGHVFALDLAETDVWDYERDCYAHRIIANGLTTDGEKLVELPGSRTQGQITALQDDSQDLAVIKRDNLALEYTQLLTSQLETQRVYFEEVVARAVDKATDASKRAERAAEEATAATAQIQDIMAENRDLTQKAYDAERDASRHQVRFSIQQNLMKELKKEKEEAKALSDSTSERVNRLEEEVATKNYLLEYMQEEAKDLRVQIAAIGKIKEMVNDGRLSAEDLDTASIELRPTAVTKVAASSKQQTQRVSKNNDPIPMPLKDPTESELKAALDNTGTDKTIGLVGTLLMDASNAEKDYVYTAGTTEANLVRCMREKDLLEQRGLSFELKSKVHKEAIISALLEARLIQTKSSARVSETSKLSSDTISVLQRLAGNHYLVTSDMTDAELHEILVGQNVLVLKEEDGLYESDTTVPDGVNTSNTSKSKKKKKKNKKKH